MRPFALPSALLLLAFASLGLSSCGSTEPLAPQPSPSPERVEAIGIVSVISTVRLGPLWGCPKETADRMTSLLDSAANKARVALLNYDGASGDYLLRGDLNALRYQGKIRLTYNWYVLNARGTEVGRRSGMEIAEAAGGSGGIWGEVPEASLQAVARQGIAAVLSRR